MEFEVGFRLVWSAMGFWKYGRRKEVGKRMVMDERERDSWGIGEGG